MQHKYIYAASQYYCEMKYKVERVLWTHQSSSLTSIVGLDEFCATYCGAQTRTRTTNKPLMSKKKRHVELRSRQLNLDLLLVLTAGFLLQDEMNVLLLLQFSDRLHHFEDSVVQ